MDGKLNNGDRGNTAAAREWLAGLMLQRDTKVVSRFVFYYRELARRPRQWRRMLQRKLAVTVTGAALLLALAGGSAGTTALAEPAAPDTKIYVAYGEVAIVDNGTCSLIEAIINARATRAGQLHDDCAAGNLSGPDTVMLPPNGLFVLTEPHNDQFGPTGLPVITDDMTIEGNGATIRRSTTSGTPEFRIMAVDQGVNMVLRNTTISDGRFNEESNYSHYTGAGIENRGNLTLENCTIRYNYTYAWGSGIRNSGNLVVSYSSIIDNAAYNGGSGISSSGTATITGSLIANNWAFYYTGGIENTGEMVITNSTVTGNSGFDGDGGIKNYVNSTLTLNNTTVTGNRSTYSGFGGIVNGGTLDINGSVISGNYNTYHDYIVIEEIHNYGTVTTNNFNLVGHDSEAGTSGINIGPTDIVPSASLEAILSPLADNGGPTQTHALPPGSPAIDLAPSALCAAAPVNGADQRGQPRNANGAGGASANECDAGSFELQDDSVSEGAFLISPAGSGAVGGVAFTPADILKYDPAAGWSIYFDGSDVGATKNLTAFELLDNGHILMSFAGVTNGFNNAGTVSPQDIVRFIPTATGANTFGTFEKEFQGSARWLSTSTEKIDALGDIGGGRVAVSTTGTAKVKMPDGSILTAQDEDAMGLETTDGRWSPFFNGTAIHRLGVEDVNALWIDPATGDLYVSIVGPFNIGGISGDGKDIVKLAKTAGAPGGYVPSLWWDGSAAGFPTTIDGLEILR